MEFGDYIGATCQGAVAGADQMVGWQPLFCTVGKLLDMCLRLLVPLVRLLLEERSAPESGWYNCNTDTARHSVVQCTCIAGLVRDPDGHWLQGLSSFTMCVLEPRLAKAFAVREALSWLRRKEVDSVIVESDSLLVINAITGNGVDDSELSLLI
ncbi:hypothetical protein J1N35_006860 [Gossypium stocksii]|uniref:RNase H type-1 domain-containing protein n=1 Tax=Gossypium stocksii TaxID=47602 RepID=A0A9D3W5X6_9ROSI|nr:hypothetical protein J1N35_006860 [Gossypium stocksii]